MNNAHFHLFDFHLLSLVYHSGLVSKMVEFHPNCRFLSPYHAFFMHCMLIRPTPEELESFGSPDWVIYNGGEFPADPNVPVFTPI